jgi:hypothetical protein
MNKSWKIWKAKHVVNLQAADPISVPHGFSWGCWGKTTFFRCFPFSLWPHFRTPWPFPISRGGCKAMFLDNAKGTWSRVQYVQWDAIEAAWGCFRVVIVILLVQWCGFPHSVQPGSTARLEVFDRALRRIAKRNGTNGMKCLKLKANK